ncbi:Gfo/Idh/MocA family protein [Cytobacillus sp. FJAT-54145]|uniref:Gfo/Idh/MocA family protein n=1 Tax=Cytobacillus spartinae TaxID=3299023 RepID=A0ABW6KBR6_9BACI
MKSSIKMGIIGLGAFGAKILNPISFFHPKEELEVVAVCDINENVAKDIAGQFEVPHWFQSYQEMLETIDLDVVYIATPPATHEQITRDVIQKGIHVFCEKPLANSISEARNMLELANEAKVIHALHFGQNYLPGLNTFHQMIEEGYAGEIDKIFLKMHYPSWPPEWQQNEWIASRDGGFLLEQGIHFIQAIQRVFGKITHIQSEVHYPSPGQSEDGVIATMILKSGITIVVEGSTDVSFEEDVSLTAYGSEGTVMFDFKGVKAAKVGSELKEVELGEPSPWILTHIINAIKGEPAEIYDFKVGYEAQVVLDILRQGENKLVSLEPYHNI